MPRPRRFVTAETVRQSAKQAGLLISEERIRELVPMLQNVLQGIDELRELVKTRSAEPALTFHVTKD